jgi:5'-methylthioadenosine phosphorylase
VTVDMVVEILRRNAKLAQQAIEQVVARVADLDEIPCQCRQALGQAFITETGVIPRETREKLRPLVSKYLD